jgi:hypothetical protein
MGKRARKFFKNFVVVHAEGDENIKQWQEDGGKGMNGYVPQVWLFDAAGQDLELMGHRKSTPRFMGDEVSLMMAMQKARTRDAVARLAREDRIAEAREFHEHHIDLTAELGTIEELLQKYWGREVQLIDDMNQHVRNGGRQGKRDSLWRQMNREKHLAESRAVQDATRRFKQVLHPVAQSHIDMKKEMAKKVVIDPDRANAAGAAWLKNVIEL